MLTHTWFSKGRAIVVLLSAVACVCFGVPASAADLGDADLATVQVWYQPTLMPSVDEASGTINALRFSFTDWRGGIVKNVVATSTHVDIHTNIYVPEQSYLQWMPSWGGVANNGGFTPYSSGSTQTTQKGKNKPADLSLVPGEIVSITLWSYPNLEQDYKTGFDLQLSSGNTQSAMSFRTPNIDVARRLADAFATLAAANFTDGRRYNPSLGIRAQTQDLPAQYSRLNWAQGSGLIIDAVIDDSPAAAAGLKHDDIIFEADGKPVLNALSVSKIATDFLGTKVEGRLDLKIFRGGQTIPVQLALKNPNIGIEKLLPAQAPAPAQTSVANAPAPTKP